VREFRDVAPGTIPRSLVWVTEHPISAGTIVARWERHRFLLGGPLIMRWFPERRGDIRASRRWGGVVRVARDPNDPSALPRHEALLSHHDARFILERLSRFAAREGMRVAVELLGTSGWVDASGCDPALDTACGRLLEIDGSTLADMKTDAARLDALAVNALFDELLDDLANTKDGSGAAHIQSTLVRTARVLTDVDLKQPDSDAGNGSVADAQRAIEAAAQSAKIHALLIASAAYEAPRSGSFTDVLDRLAIEHGARAIGDAWRPVSREEACATWRATLTRSLAYDSPLLPEEHAAALVEGFVEGFDHSALFYRNGDDGAYSPILDNTLEKGAGVIDGDRVGILFAGDED